tara:strand:- start:64564 stop:65124 length:561 start_codon:yes stop_codon:yes gene_type:complete
MLTRTLFKPIAALLIFCLAGSVVLTASADSKDRIDSATRNALERLQQTVDGTDKLLAEAAGVLVFPDIVKMGFGGAGDQYGEGSLLVEDEPVGYYATAGAKFGLPLGTKLKSEVIFFMTEDALDEFMGRRGWKVGVDSQVAMVRLGPLDSLETTSLKGPVLAFVLSDHGLSEKLTLDGSNVMRIAR